MVEVLEKGEDRVHRVTCDNCSSRLQYKNSDKFVKEVTLNMLSGRKNICDYYTINCPNCHNNIQLASIGLGRFVD